MNKTEAIVKIAAIMTSLLEMDDHGSPESLLYMHLDSNIHKYNALRNVMLSAGWVTIHGNYVKLTAAGVIAATKMQAAFTPTTNGG